MPSTDTQNASATTAPITTANILITTVQCITRCTN